MGRSKKSTSTIRHILSQIDLSENLNASESTAQILEKQASASGSSTAIFNNNINEEPYKLLLPSYLKDYNDDEMSNRRKNITEKKDYSDDEMSNMQKNN